MESRSDSSCWLLQQRLQQHRHTGVVGSGKHPNEGRGPLRVRVFGHHSPLGWVLGRNLWSTTIPKSVMPSHRCSREGAGGGHQGKMSEIFSPNQLFFSDLGEGGGPDPPLGGLRGIHCWGSILGPKNSPQAGYPLSLTPPGSPNKNKSLTQTLFFWTETSPGPDFDRQLQ